MSATIQTQIALIHIESGLPANSAVQRTSVGSNFSPLVVTVGASDETVDLGDVTTPKQVMLKLISGDAVRVGLDGSTYPFRLTDADEAMLLRLDTEGIVEVSQVETLADVAGSLNDKYFLLTDWNGEVKVVITNDGVTALTSSGRVVVVTIANNADDDTVASAIVAAFVSDSDFTASASGPVVTFRDKHTGTRSNVAAGDSGFSVATQQQGAASPVIHMKSLGSSQVLTAVAPH
jgi:hypothetical protein